jgi:hypothetical protein
MTLPLLTFAGGDCDAESAMRTHWRSAESRHMVLMR